MQKFKNWISLLVFVFLSILITPVLAISYSNIVIFGDSQSDIGNMPEAINLNTKTKALYYFDGIPYNLYIPASNPSIAIDNEPIVTVLNFAQLPSQPPIKGKIIRMARSLNWSQYLFLALRMQGKLNSSSLLPWTNIHQKSFRSSQNVSVDYAFAGALSGNTCADEGYFPAPENICTESNVYAAQNNYRMHPDRDDLHLKVLIPGVQKQIDFFKQDVAAKKVSVNDHTLYIIWIGANDLGLNFHMLVQGKFNLFMKNLDQNIPQNTLTAISQLQATGAKNIVIIGQQNLGLTPEASLITRGSKHFVTRYLSAYVLNALVLKYNLALTQLMVTFSVHHPDVQLTYVPLQSLFNRLSLLPGKPFYHTLGLACQNKNPNTYNDIAQGKIINCRHYLYWNRAHMTDVGNQWVAKEILLRLGRS